MNKRKKVWAIILGTITFFCVALACSSFIKVHVNFSYSECSKAKKIGFSQYGLVGKVDYYYEDDLTINNISKDISNLSYSVSYSPFVQFGNIQTTGTYSILFFYYREPPRAFTRLYHSSRSFFRSYPRLAR